MCHLVSDARGAQLVSAISAFIFITIHGKQASLLEPSLDLARGGDLSRTATEAAMAPGGHGRGAPAPLHAPLTGLQLYRAVEARAAAAAVPFLPGALMSPVLVQLHSRMQFVVADKKPAAGGSGEPAETALHLSRGHTCL